MQTSMRLRDLLSTVISMEALKRDFTTSTQDNVRIVQGYGPENSGLFIVLLRDGAEELERFGITENAHRQISAKLGIPWKYYDRLLTDHRDLVISQVNALFEREPSSRLLRVLDGKVRAFLSDRYLRLDNNEVLASTLPVITEGMQEESLRVMSAHVDDNNMHMKVIFTGDELAHEVTRARGEPRIIRPGFRLSNSETGQGSLKMEGFFYDSYCTNGCVFGMNSAFKFNRTHLGGRLIEGEGFQVLSDDTRKLEDQAILSAVRDGMKAISSPEAVGEMVEFLRAKAGSEKTAHPVAAVEKAVKELDLRDAEKEGILETFLRDMDYSQYGLAAAVTEQANDPDKCSYTRACELENIGAQLLQLSARQWHQYATAELEAA